MSTTTTPVAVATATKSTFGFKSVGHFFASAFSDLKKATAYVETKVLPTTQKVIETAETYTQVLAPFVPQANIALTVERALDSAAGELLAAVHTTDAVQGASTVDLKLSIDSYNAFKQFIADQKTALDALGYKL